MKKVERNKYGKKVNALDACKFNNKWGRVLEPEEEYYHYHPDHLGSSSWITDPEGRPVQHIQYLPFGETWADQRSANWNAPYTFSGKEKDWETSYHYYGARYYDSDLNIWLSVDPLASKTPGVNPYAYCVNNPIILFDPDGRDWYTADSKGNIYLYKEIKGSKTDHIVALDGKGNVRLDKNGDLKKYSFSGKQISQEVSKGSFENIKKDGETLIDFKGNGREALGVFNVLSDNTNVEWGIVGFKDADGKKQFKVGSSHDSYEEGSASREALKNSKNGNLLVYNHSHPILSVDGIDFGATGGFPSVSDNTYWGDVLKNSPNAGLGIRFRGSTDYHHNKPANILNLFYK